MFDIDSGTVALGVAALGAQRLQLVLKDRNRTAGAISGIPVESDVELDAVDGKNVFYLPPGCDYTATMAVEEMDMKKKKDKAALNEQLILESVGKANGMGPGGEPWDRGKVRTTTSEIPNKSADVVLSSGAIGRVSADKRGLTVNEALRILRPGGLFVFIEKEDTGVEALVDKFFPQDVIAGKVAGGNKRGDGSGKKKKKLGRRKRIQQQAEVVRGGEKEVEDEGMDERGEVEIEIEGEAGAEAVEEGAVEVEVVSSSSEPKKAQAIFKQRINLLVTSYVVGIATKL